LSCNDDSKGTDDVEENSFSSSPVLIADQGNATVIQPSFHIGSGTTSSTTKPKRQKLKHMARNGVSSAEIQSIAGIKRAHAGTNFVGVAETTLDSNLPNAARGEGVNPDMAPNYQ
ncbi:hypothetical protein PIB30_115185, partial [Stylosanthes scabra]|nr:hypothetical protein [Stylosanthes scabra]